MERFTVNAGPPSKEESMLELIALMALIDLFLALLKGGDRHDNEE